MVPGWEAVLGRGEWGEARPEPVLLYGSSRTWWAELEPEYWVSAELAEQVDRLTIASARDFSTAQRVIFRN